MGNSKAKRRLNALYGCRCMLTNIKGRDNLTFHHVNKKEWGGTASVEDGANLNHDIHSWLHEVIEMHDIELFYLINECLQLYKKCLDTHNEELIRQYEEECMPIYRDKYEGYKKRR